MIFSGRRIMTWHRYGEWYINALNFVSKLLDITPQKIGRYMSNKQKIYLERKREVIARIKKLEEEMSTLNPYTPEYRKRQDSIKSLERKLLKMEQMIRNEEFTEAMEFLGFDISEYEVIIASTFYALLFFVGMMIFAIATYTYLNIGVIDLFVYFILPTVFGTIGTFAYLANYPEILSKRLRLKSIGSAPEAVTYMCVSMRLNPSLNRAVSFTANNLQGPLASDLKKVLWDVYIKKYHTIEESFLAFANHIGKWNEDLKRSLYFIRASILETTKEGLRQALDKAHSTIIDGIKTTVNKYANSLHAPVMVFFALGIMLPLVIGAMLPMLSIKPTNITSNMEHTSTTGNSTSQTNPISLVFLMDIMFPLLAFAYAYHILGRRPAVTSRNTKLAGPTLRWYLIGIIVALFVSVAILYFIQIYMRLNTELMMLLWVLLPLWMVTVVIMWLCLQASEPEIKTRKYTDQLEKEFPDALYHLGSRIAEGKPMAQALNMTAENMKGTEIGTLFRDIGHRIRVSKQPLKDLLFGKNGALSNVDSDTIKGYMRMVVVVEDKDPHVAGELIMSAANYLRDLKKTIDDMKIQMKRIVDIMSMTATVFAPIILGITSALYLMLSSITSETGMGMSMIPVHVFTGILAVYMIEFLIVAVYFGVGVEHGEDDHVAMANKIGRSLPVAIAIFTLTLIIARYTII